MWIHLLRSDLDYLNLKCLQHPSRDLGELNIEWSGDMFMIHQFIKFSWSQEECHWGKRKQPNKDSQKYQCINWMGKGMEN